jgi:HEAT repeat protein
MKPLSARLIAVTIAVVLLPTCPAGGTDGRAQVDTVALVRALEDPSDDVRRQAAAALVKQGAKAVPDLLEALGHKKQDVRLQVMEVLGTIGPAATTAVPLLGRALREGALREGDDADASAAASALARIGPAAVPVLLDLAGHKVEHTRNHALEALAAIRGDPEHVVPALADALQHKDVAIRRHATTALLRMTTEPIAPVVRAFQDEDAQLRAQARQAMLNSKHRTSSAWTKALEKLLHHANPGVRGDALQVLAHDRQTRMKYGLQCLHDADAGVRRFAIYALDHATYPIEFNPYTVNQIVAQIAPVLTDPSKDVRKTAYTMMQRSGAEGVPYLAKLLDAKDSDIRQRAAAALLYNGGKKPDLVEAKLFELAERDPDVAVRAAAVYSYSQLGPKRIPALAKLFRQERNDAVREAVMRAVCQHREDAASLVPDFIETLNDGNPEVRRAAAYTFYWITKAGKQAIVPLTAMLADKDADTRVQAIYSLSMLTPESEPGIIEGIKSGDAKVQEMALHTFWQRGLKSKPALPWLIKALNKERPHNVRSYAVYCLGNLGADARDAIPVLEAITEPEMQIHVQFGLKRIRGMDKK